MPTIQALIAAPPFDPPLPIGCAGATAARQSAMDGAIDWRGASSMAASPGTRQAYPDLLVTRPQWFAMQQRGVMKK